MIGFLRLVELAPHLFDERLFFLLRNEFKTDCGRRAYLRLSFAMHEWSINMNSCFGALKKIESAASLIRVSNKNRMIFLQNLMKCSIAEGFTESLHLGLTEICMNLHSIDVVDCLHLNLLSIPAVDVVFAHLRRIQPAMWI